MNGFLYEDNNDGEFIPVRPEIVFIGGKLKSILIPTIVKELQANNYGIYGQLLGLYPNEFYPYIICPFEILITDSLNGGNLNNRNKTLPSGIFAFPTILYEDIFRRKFLEIPTPFERLEEYSNRTGVPLFKYNERNNIFEI